MHFFRCKILSHQPNFRSRLRRQVEMLKFRPFPENIFSATLIPATAFPLRITHLRHRLRDLGAKPCHEDRLLRCWSQACSCDKAHSPAESFFPLALCNALHAIETELGKLARLHSEFPLAKVWLDYWWNCMMARWWRACCCRAAVCAFRRKWVVPWAVFFA